MGAARLRRQDRRTNLIASRTNQGAPLDGHQSEAADRDAEEMHPNAGNASHWRSVDVELGQPFSWHSSCAALARDAIGLRTARRVPCTERQPFAAVRCMLSKIVRAARRVSSGLPSSFQVVATMQDVLTHTKSSICRVAVAS